MTKLKKLIKTIPVLYRVFFCLFPVAVCLHAAFIIWGDFAELYCRSVGHGFRTVLATVTNFLPMSLAEAGIIFMPFIFASIVIYVIRTKGEYVASVRVISGLISVITLVYSLFVFTFAAGFYGKDIGEYFGVNRRKLTVNELYSAAVVIVDRANEAYSEIDGKGLGSTTMGMDYGTMNDLILEGFDKLYDEYKFPARLSSRVKPVVLSEPMTYTHISGVYTFFTGEANINVNYPDFVIPYTAAHELSHQRGVSREDEANFAAFLVCEAVENPYIRYSGYLNMYQYMASAIASVSYEKYVELYNRLDDGIKKELSAYSKFFDKYRESVSGKVSDAVNDSYLSVMAGTDSRSYGMVVDLATVYILEEKQGGE